jgi:TnpA family transposase
MHGTINVKSPNNTSKWQMGFNSAFKGLMQRLIFVLNSRCTNRLLRNVDESLNKIQGVIKDKTAIKFSKNWRIRTHYVPGREQGVM